MREFRMCSIKTMMIAWTASSELSQTMPPSRQTITTVSSKAFREYLEAGKECGLKVNFAQKKTEVLLGECRNHAEVERRISEYETVAGIT